jgi:hypothetical protein
MTFLTTKKTKKAQAWNAIGRRVSHPFVGPVFGHIDKRRGVDPLWLRRCRDRQSCIAVRQPLN